MSQSEVIKELFVKLGFQIDDASQKKFQTATRNAVIQAELILKAVEAAAKAFGKMLAHAAESFDGLFYASQRIGSTVGNIKSYSNAIAQLGGSVDGARSSLENFGKFMRSQPGAASFLAGFGVKVGRDNVANLSNFAQNIASKNPYYLQLKYAELLGIDESTWRALTSGEYAARFQEQKSILARMGLDPEKMADDSRKFMNGLRNVGTAIDAILDKVMSNFLGDGANGLKGLQQFLEQHGKEIADAITEVVKAMVELIKQFVEFVAKDNGAEFHKQISDAAEAIKNAATWIKDFITQIRVIFQAMKEFNDQSKDWWITKFLNWAANPSAAGASSWNPFAMSQAQAAAPYGGMDPHADDAGSGLWGGVKNWWGRNAPSWLGGNPRMSAKDMPAGTGTGSDVKQMVDAAAKRYGVDPRVLYGIIAGESAHGNRYDVGDGGRSFSMWQMYLGGGLGNRFEKETGLSVKDPKNIKAITDWVAAYIARTGDLSPWHGYHGPRNWNQAWGNMGYSPDLGTNVRNALANVFGSSALAAGAPPTDFAPPGIRRGEDGSWWEGNFRYANGERYSHGGQTWELRDGRWWPSGEGPSASVHHPHGMTGLRGALSSMPLGVSPQAQSNTANDNTQNVHQTNHITVNGQFDDPHMMAGALERMSFRSNRHLQDLLRNGNGAAQ